MKGRPIVIAVGSVLMFSLGLLAGRLWGETSRPLIQQLPTADLGPAPLTTVIDGVAIQHAPDARLSVSIEDYASSTDGTTSLSREGDAVGPGLRTTSERVGSAFEASSPTVGSVSGGSVISTVEAFASSPFNVFYVIGALCLVAGGVAALGFKRIGLGVGIAVGGLSCIVVGYFATSQPWVLWIVAGLAAVGIAWWLLEARSSTLKAQALGAVTGAVEAAKRVDPVAASLVKKFVPDMAGDRNLLAIKREIEKAKSS